MPDIDDELKYQIIIREIKKANFVIRVARKYIYNLLQFEMVNICVLNHINVLLKLHNNCTTTSILNLWICSMKNKVNLRSVNF
jgi:hypothetical protein